MTTTLKLGAIEFRGEADSDGKSMRVVIRGAIDTDVHFMTVDEWQSLVTLAAEHAKDREEIERLRAALITNHDALEHLRSGRWEIGYVKERVARTLTAARDALALREPGDGYCPCGERLDREHHHDL